MLAWKTRGGRDLLRFCSGHGCKLRWWSCEEVGVEWVTPSLLDIDDDRDGGGARRAEW